jgi:rod shape determining protein RodA
LDGKKELKKYSRQVIYIILVLLGMGLLTLYSVSGGAFWIKQAVFAGLGATIVYTIFKLLDLKFFQDFSWVFYIVNIALLIALKFLGTTILGSQRWIKLGPLSIQPSEFAKVFLIIFLAAWLSKYPIRNFVDIVKALVLISIPSFLVLIQPDLGTTLVYIAICFGMLYWAGARLIELLILLSPILAAVCSALNPVLFSYQGGAINFQVTLPLVIFIAVFFSSLYFFLKAWTSPWISSVVFVLLGVNALAVVFRELVWGLLKEYQQKRLTIFLDPYADPLGAGYQFIQSIYAIGSGGLTGKGIGAGDLTQGQFVPEQHTDFIFSAIGEEYGLIGTFIVVILFTALLFNLIRIAGVCKNEFVSLLAIGTFSMLFFHVFVNIGMNLSVMPITGVPLPFMSYGGSSMLVNIFLISLVLLCAKREKIFS